jgi:SAM-dependent methyltransferase
MTSANGALALYVCPQCLGPLVMAETAALCHSCGKQYARDSHGFLDLRVDCTNTYHDWLSASDQEGQRYQSAVALTEASGSQHMMEDYLIPLLKRFDIPTEGKILSVGCGGGWDVETLTKRGYHAWGIDNGGRVMVWKDRTCVEALSVSDALQLPFPDDTFDLVLSEGVIEHIGYGGDTSVPLPDWRSRQAQFARSLSRATRPGGYVLVTCPNRLFPVDFFHGGRPFHSFSIRPHSPFETFLLSFGDIRRLFSEQAEWVKPLSLRGFFNLERISGESGLVRVGTRMLQFALDVLPERFWGTAMSPYIVVLTKKREQREK